jgi:TonB family protein
MKELLVYAFESSICLLCLWLFYAVFLSGDTHHSRNRFYLLMSSVISVLIPMMSFSLRSGSPFLPPEGLARLFLPETRITALGTQAGPLADFSFLFALLYIGGAAIAAILFLFASVRLLWLILAKQNDEKIILFDSEKHICYSAFGYIFISRGIHPEDAERMIAHERNHISRMHHFDLLLAGVINIIQWFNPASYLLRQSLQTIHEYQADSECISRGEEIASYQKLLVSAVLSTRLAILSNPFSNTSLLKNRFIMMTKKKSGSISSLKILLAVPLVSFLLFTFSCNESGKELAAPEPVDPSIGSFDSLLNDNVFNVPAEMPVFGTELAKSNENLFKWIGENIIYPEAAKVGGITGKVIIGFIVDENGNVIKPNIIKSADPVLDQAALEMMAKFPKWQPGMYEGKPVKVKMALPITFALN